MVDIHPTVGRPFTSGPVRAPDVRVQPDRGGPGASVGRGETGAPGEVWRTLRVYVDLDVILVRPLDPLLA